jgi:hypothetical protein
MVLVQSERKLSREEWNKQQYALENEHQRRLTLLFEIEQAREKLVADLTVIETAMIHHATGYQVYAHRRAAAVAAQNLQAQQQREFAAWRPDTIKRLPTNSGTYPTVE